MVLNRVESRVPREKESEYFWPYSNAICIREEERVHSGRSSLLYIYDSLFHVALFFFIGLLFFKTTSIRYTGCFKTPRGSREWRMEDKKLMGWVLKLPAYPLRPFLYNFIERTTRLREFKILLIFFNSRPNG